jgi:allantoinase
MNMESLYDYGSRAGFWRLHRMFTSRKMPVTVFAVGMALERNPAACGAMIEAGWEVASHGYRWIDYQNVDPETEQEHMDRTVEIHERLLGRRPVGFYQGKVRTSFSDCIGIMSSNGTLTLLRCSQIVTPASW